MYAVIVQILVLSTSYKFSIINTESVGDYETDGGREGGRTVTVGSAAQAPMAAGGL